MDMLIELVAEVTNLERTFLYRLKRFKVLQKKRDLQDGVRVTEDLIWENREKKKKLKDVMKAAFRKAGKGRDFIEGNFT